MGSLPRGVDTYEPIIAWRQKPETRLANRRSNWIVSDIDCDMKSMMRPVYNFAFNDLASIQIYTEETRSKEKLARKSDF